MPEWVIRMKKHRIEICMGSSCFARGNDRNLAVIEDFLVRYGLGIETVLSGSRCEGKCPEGPNINIDGEFFNKVCPGDLEEILKRIFLEGEERCGS